MSEERHFVDDSIIRVMVAGEWWEVQQGSWHVVEGGAFERAEWVSAATRDRMSAFLNHVQMVQHSRVEPGK